MAGLLYHLLTVLRDKENISEHTDIIALKNITIGTHGLGHRVSALLENAKSKCN